MDVEELTRCLKAAFNGSTVKDVGPPPGGSRIGGVLLWPGFEGVSQIERQDRVWEALREQFSHDELLGVSLILTFTPEEHEAILQD